MVGPGDAAGLATLAVGPPDLAVPGLAVLGLAVGAGGLEKRPQPATRAAVAMSPSEAATNEGDRNMRLKR
jgi:hypothetical protein